jgi:hypothetical protein
LPLQFGGDRGAMQLHCPLVDAQADEESVLFKKGPLLVVKQCAVRLEIIFDTLVRLLVLWLELDDLVEELRFEQSRLAAFAQP